MLEFFLLSDLFIVLDCVLYLSCFYYVIFMEYETKFDHYTYKLQYKSFFDLIFQIFR